MKNFIKITRQDRNHEIINYETKGYCFINKNDYALIDKIQVNYYGYCMDLRIRVGCQEPSFLLINEGANIELSLTDVYSILSASLSTVIPICIDLKKQLNSSYEKSGFIYKDNEYQMIKPIKVSESLILKTPRTNIDIPYCQIIVLLALIQSKSSYFFSSGSDEKKKYIGGIYRLLICLLSVNSDHLLLKKRGWIWNKKNNRFELRKDKADINYIMLKYYLTQDEMETIMNV